MIPLIGAGDYSVIKFENGKTLFSGSRVACMNFIENFDRQSKKYVDLRMLDVDGKEVKYHEEIAGISLLAGAYAKHKLTREDVKEIAKLLKPVLARYTKRFEIAGS